MKISDSLKRFRENYGYTRNDVASNIGILPQAYYKYETDQNIPSAELIIKIADAFDVSTDYLLGRSQVPNNRIADEILKSVFEFEEKLKSINRPSVHTL